eukprot:TRINITY_DN1584_c0_g1_i1.p1 TRINITY_DN1584_c0_g1~~TRINITY_DN1584_c0_g1_i1.p1  ORF type:complete len:500 (+),score=101.85 TRINITY_DN1584_c0_g1_i1:46-1545(+)
MQRSAAAISIFVSVVGVSVATSTQSAAEVGVEANPFGLDARDGTVDESHHTFSLDASRGNRQLRGRMPHFLASHHRQHNQRKQHHQREGQQQGQQHQGQQQQEQQFDQQMGRTEHAGSPCDSISRQMQWAVADPGPLNTSAIIHSLHPLVGGALGRMDEQLHELQNDRSAVGGNLRRFVEASGDADLHMNEVLDLRRKIKAEQSILRARKRRFKKLDTEARHLNLTRNALRLKLRAVMDIKVAAAEGRLETQNRLLKEADSVVRNLSSMRDHYKELALKNLQTRREAQKALEQADAQVAEAKQKQQNATMKFLVSKKDAIRGEQAYKYVNTRFRAEKSRQKWVKQRAILSKKSVARMQGILTLGEARLQKAFLEGEQNLKTKVAEAKAAENKTLNELEDAEAKYAEWQASQKQRAKEEAARKAAYVASLKAYGERHQELLKAAQDRAGAAAVRKSDWTSDDWAWSGPDVSDSLEVDSSFDDIDQPAAPAPGPQAMQAAP